MGKIVLQVSSWLLRTFGLLVVVIAAMLLAPTIREMWAVAREFDPDAFAQEFNAKAPDWAPGKGAPGGVIEKKVRALHDRKIDREAERAALESQSCFLPKCHLIRSARVYRLDMEIQFITQALIYSEAVIGGAQQCTKEASARNDLNALHAEDDALEQERPRWMFWRTREHKDLKARIEDLKVRLSRHREVCETYRKLSPLFQPNQSAVLRSLSGPYGDFLAEMEELKQTGQSLWESIKAVFAPALLVLLGILLTPTLVKLVSYYGVAPLASRRFHVRLFPEASGELAVLSGPDALLRIELDVASELLVDPALLRSAPDSSRKRTRILLDWSMPLSSVVSHLFLLTNIRTSGNGVVTIAAGDDPLSKIAVLEIPEGGVLVLQPRCLAGVVQQINRPLRITRHWRLTNLASWLTLQLRYVVFHGPVRLIVRGKRGIAVDSAQEGTAINQAATLGFSANLGYAVTRCETYFAFHIGKQELFNDCFSAGSGYYVHEVYPRRSTTSMLPGRGIEALLNSVLKVFGL